MLIPLNAAPVTEVPFEKSESKPQVLYLEEMWKMHEERQDGRGDRGGGCVCVLGGGEGTARGLNLTYLRPDVCVEDWKTYP